MDQYLRRVRGAPRPAIGARTNTRDAPSAVAPRGRRARRPHALLLAGLAVGSMVALAGCGDGGITADTKCSDYLAHDSQDRHDAAVRLSSELKAQNPGNPLWGFNLDAVCGSARDITLREYFTR